MVKILKIFFFTFGCKVNASEDETAMAELTARGAVIAENVAEADAVVLNTCAVTEAAAKKCAAHIAKLRRSHPHLKIIATGCLASDTQADLKKYGADIVVPNTAKSSIADIIFADSQAQRRVVKKSVRHTRAFYKIQDGCDAFCSYCIIPTLRGAPVSKPFDEAVAGFGELVAAGYKEIVLVGIHIGLYGRGENFSLAALLRELVKIEGDFRIRLSSVEVGEVTEELITLMAENSAKICPHLHIPLQSGSARILGLMGRRYSPADYIAAVAAARERVAGLMVGSDIIVGFPSETEDDFMDSVNTLATAGTELYHVFPYSDRRGTKASAMDGKLSEQEKSSRADRLRAAGAESLTKAQESSVGKTFTVLTERGNKGHAGNYLPVLLKGTKREPNEFVTVRITEIKNGKVYGEEV